MVASYLGAGLVKAEPIPGRKDDQLGFAIARAGIGDDARRLQGLPDAETTLEATYRFTASPNFALQPDLQYVIHPAAAPGLRDALVVGLRLIVTVNEPAGSSDSED